MVFRAVEKYNFITVNYRVFYRPALTKVRLTVLFNEMSDEFEGLVMITTHAARIGWNIVTSRVYNQGIQNYYLEATIVY